MKQKLNGPRLFRERYRRILGDEVKVLVDYCFKPLRKSIRINTLKIDVDECVKMLESKGWELKQVPWCSNGFWVENRNEEQLGNTLEHFMGYYYVQEASSMIPPIVLQPEEKDFVLDIAAAPGSKTTQMAEMMKNKGCIVANDIQIQRIKVLRFNLEKLGVINTVVTRMDGRKFIKFKERFDKVLVDAPCSSEGIMRKDWKAFSRWNIKFIKEMAKLQKKLVDAAAVTLKRGGVMVYSTCTMSPEENEAVVDYAVKKHGLVVEKVKVKGLKARHGITEWESQQFDESVRNCLRIWPHDNDSEGFFVANVRK